MSCRRIGNIERIKRICIVGICLGLETQDFVHGQSIGARAIIDECHYPSDAAAQAIWQPMQGSPPVRIAMLDGRQVLRMPCRFAGTKVERGSWDRKVKLDLSDAGGIQLQFFCRDASPVSYFSIYFKSGAGWYHASFFPESTSAWDTITLKRSDFTIEGNPSGWDQVGTIRVSAWRGRDVDTEFFLRDLREVGVLGVDALTVVLRAGAASQQWPGRGRVFQQSAELVAQDFRGAGIECAVLSDLELKPGQLDQVKLVVLPNNPIFTKSIEDTLIQYLRRGGKLLAFQTAPENVLTTMGLERGARLKPARPGRFSSVRFRENALAGAPRTVLLPAADIEPVKPVGDSCRVLADWFDDEGRSTREFAALGSTNFIFLNCALSSDDARNRQQMLVAMASSLSPELGRQAAETTLNAIGTIASFKSYEDAKRAVRELARENALATKALESANALRQSALKLLAGQNFVAANTKAVEAREQLIEAFCLAQKALPGEFRAFWCHSAFGVKGIDWDEAIRRLAANGFTAILPNMLWGGVAYYDSKLLPVAGSVAEQGDQIRQCLAACRKYGIQAHIWKVNWNLGSASPKEFRDRMRGEGRLQANSQGKEEPWLCPSHPANQSLEIDSMIEVVRNYDVDGVHFDYIRYPDNDHCFCTGCRERFQRAFGLASVQWPMDVMGEGPQRQNWLEWRRSNITAVVTAVSKQARALKPKIKISAAVFPNLPVDRDHIGQDWQSWCKEGYLDFVCPMDYTPVHNRFEGLVSRQVQWAGRTPCYPGIGLSTARFGPDRLIEQINLTRQHNTGGFVIFNYNVTESQDVLPKLGLGITKRP